MLYCFRSCFRPNATESFTHDSPSPAAFQAPHAVVQAPKALPEGVIGRDTVGQEEFDSTVGRAHATLHRGFLLDMDSKYGTVVNGKLIGPQGQRLKKGDLVRFGRGATHYKYTGAGLRVMTTIIGRAYERWSAQTHGTGDGDFDRATNLPGILRDGPIGRESTHHVNGDLSMSLRHAHLDEGYLKDVNSRNGTYVNDERLEYFKDVVLQEGDRVHFASPEHSYVYHNGVLLLEKPAIAEIDEDQLKNFQHTRFKQYFSCSSDGILKNIKSPGVLKVDGQPVHGPVQLVDGNIVRLHADDPVSCYYAQGRLHPITDEHAELMEKLFPDGLKATDFQQKGRGSGAFLSALHAYLIHKPENIIHLLEPQPHDKVRVHFRNRSVIVSLQEAIDSEVTGQLGIKLLEIAYDRMRKEMHNISSRPHADQSAEPYTVHDKGDYLQNALCSIVQGKSTTTVTNFHQPLANEPQLHIGVSRILRQIERDPGNRIAIAATPKQLSYTVGQVDQQVSQNIFLHNPRDSQGIIKMSIPEFMNNFAQIAVVDA